MYVCQRAAAFAALVLCTSTSAIAADDVTLTARNGDLTFSGRLIGHDGPSYRIETRWGRLTVDASAVDCSGPGCPDLTRLAPELRLAVEPWLVEPLVLPLLAGFAEAEGLTLSGQSPLLELGTADKAELRIRLLPGTPEALLEAGDAELGILPPTAARHGLPLVSLPLQPASAPDAPGGVLTLPAMRQQRGAGGGWGALGLPEQPLVWHSLTEPQMLASAADTLLGPIDKADQKPGATLAEVARNLQTDPWGLALLPAPLPPGLSPRDVTLDCGLQADLSPFAAASGAHPFVLPLHWVETAPLPAIGRALSAHLHTAVARETLIAPAPSARFSRQLTDQGARLANLLADPNPELDLDARRNVLTHLHNARQLAITLPMQDPTTPGDGAAGLLALLAEDLAIDTLAGQELLLIGFTDADGSAEDNRTAAQTQAETVAAALLAANPDLPPDLRITLLTMGEAMPVACPGSPQNRRVEVWARPLPARD